MKYPNISFCEENCDKGVYERLNTICELRKNSAHPEDISELAYAFTQIREENCRNCLATLIINWKN